MPTPFQEHMQRVREARAREEQKQALVEKKPDAAEASATDYSKFELLKMSLEQDVRASKDVPRGKARDEMRDTTLLPRYLPHAEAYAASDEEYANPVLVWVMIWLLDAGRIEKAVPLAMLAIKQCQVMPNDFKRDLPVWVADEIRTWSENQFKAGHSPDPYFSDMFKALDEIDVPHVVTMKYQKLAGKIAFEQERYDDAVKHLTAANELGTSSHPAQVETLLEKAKKKAA
jgi:hypothetical protein